MPRDYESAVDDLLGAIRTYLQHQQESPVSDDTVAAYISCTDPRDMYQDLMDDPACWEPARHLIGDASTSAHVIQVMLWGRVHDRTATEPARDERPIKNQRDDTPQSD